LKLPPNPKLGDLKGAGQLLDAVLKVGKAGVTDTFIAALNQALDTQELVKIRFDEFKEEKKRLAPQIAEQTGSRLVMRVGNVAVYYRARTRPPEA
jgi:RNA-binding protein